jgi:predicted AAA+ superfamily ATPase
MHRNSFFATIEKSFNANPIVALLGPRQCGKTTIARDFFKKNHKGESQNYFDLENKDDLDSLFNSQVSLSDLKGLIVIDEVQRRPDLFTTLRVLVDRPKNKQKFLILGSASRELLQQSSETLTGRISYLELTPFNFNETENLQKLWLRGGFPKSFLAKNEEVSVDWRSNYVRTFVEQDVPNLGIRIPPRKLQHFWNMLAHYHANVLNASDLGRSLDLSHNTVKEYADVLTHTLMIRQLQPWFENISKRQVKSPKIYFRDSGIFHHHLNVKNKHELSRHPKLGASWEGFVLEEIIRVSGANPNECYFWATHADAELDLLIIKNGKRFGFEIKYSRTPKITRSIHVVLKDLRLEKLFVIYPGEKNFPMNEKVEVYGAEHFLKNFAQIISAKKSRRLAGP